MYLRPKAIIGLIVFSVILINESIGSPVSNTHPGNSSVSSLPNPSPDTICTDGVVTLSSAALLNAAGAACVPAKSVWKVSSSTGYSVVNGTLGSDFNNMNPSTWTAGSGMVSFQFMTSGIYTIKLKVGGGTCAVDSIIKTVYVNNQPNASFFVAAASGCGPYTVSVLNRSAVPLAGTNTYSWNISYSNPSGCLPNTPSATYLNGTDNQSAQPQIRFDNPGIYTLTLTTSLRGSDCAPAVLSRSITVKGKPEVVSNMPVAICDGEPLFPSVRVENCSANSDPDYVWSFPGANITSSTESDPPAITYPSPGTYTISVSVSNECGTTVFTKNIYVNPVPVLDPLPVYPPVCSRTTVSVPLSASTPAAQTTYNWVATAEPGLTGASNGSGSVISQTLRNLSGAKRRVIYSITPVYTEHGVRCNGAVVNDTIYVYPEPAISTPGDYTICSGTSTSINLAANTPVPSTTYVWTVSAPASVSGASGGTTNSIAQLLVNSSNIPQQVVYTVTATSSIDGLNCVSVAYPITVTVNPIPVITPLKTDTICSGSYQLNLSASTSVANTSYVISLVSASGAVSGATGGTANPFVQTLVNSSVLLGRVIYEVMPVFTYNGVSCNGASVFDTVYVNPMPVINPVSSTVKCSGETVEFPFSSNLAPAISSYIWTVSAPPLISGATAGSGDTLRQTIVNHSEQGLNVIYSVYPAGTFFGKQCLGDPINITVTVFPDGIAKYNHGVTTACAPFDLSTVINAAEQYPSANSAYRWYANGVLIGQGITFPGYTITNPDDSVIIKLVTPSSNGCKPDSVETKFKTLKNPAPFFQASTINGCGPLTVNFTNLTPLLDGQVLSYSWNFDNGQFSTQRDPGPVLFVPDPFGRDSIYHVYLDVTTACTTKRYQLDIRVKAKPKAVFSPSSLKGCAPFKVDFTNISRASENTYYWDYGNGDYDTTYNLNSHSYIYRVVQTDTFTVKMKAVNSCGIDSASYTIIVSPTEINSAIVINGTDNIGCAPHVVTFYNNSTGSDLHKYDFGDMSSPYLSPRYIDTVTHLYINPGTYTFTFTASNNCKDTTYTRTITVYQTPQAAFSTNKPLYCVGEEVKFFDESILADSYAWNFGDGSTDNRISPTHRYASPGSYTVTLVTSNASSSGLFCRDTFTRVVNVDNFIVPELSAALPQAIYCGPSGISLTAKNKGQFNTYWTTGDPASPGDFTQTGLNFSHQYTATGIYTIKLITENVNGCRDTLPIQIEIKAKPVAAFSPSVIQLCERGTVRFTNNSTYSGTLPVRYDWKVNSQLIIDSTHLTYSFNPPVVTDSMIYTVKLIAYDSYGCADSVTQDIVIRKNPEASFTTDQAAGCVPFQPVVTNTSLYSDNFRWYLDGVLLSSARIPSLSLTSPGTVYKLLLVSENNSNCKPDSSEITLTTYPEVIARIKASDTLGCEGQLNVSFSNKSIGATQHSWNFGDGSPVSNQLQPGHFYTAAGTYVVTYIGTSVNGCKDTTELTIKVGLKVKAAFVPSSTFSCESQTVSFRNQSVNAVRYEWHFDDATVSYDAEPTHLFYPRLTPYNVKLIAYNLAGCADSTYYNVPIKVSIPNDVSWRVDDSVKIVPDKRFYFFNTSTYPVIYRKWEFGDGQYSYELNPSHEYRFTARYEVKLTETDTNGCTSELIRYVELKDVESNLWVPNAFTPKSGSDKLKTFLPLGYGLSTYRMQVFNVAGQLLFETTKLDNNGVPVEGWTGVTADNKELPQGAYIWKIEASYQNGNVWKGMPDEDGKYKKVGTVMIVK